MKFKLSERVKSYGIAILLIGFVISVFFTVGTVVIRIDNVADSEKVCTFQEDGKSYYIYLEDISEYPNFVHISNMVAHDRDLKGNDMCTVEHHDLIIENQKKAYEEAKTTKVYHFTLREGIFLHYVDSEMIRKGKDDTFNPTYEVRTEFIENIYIRAKEKIFLNEQWEIKQKKRLEEVEALQCD